MKEVVRIKSIRMEEVVANMQGKDQILQTGIIQYEKMVPDVLTGKFRPALIKGLRSSSMMAMRYNRAGELVPNNQLQFLQEALKEGYSVPAILVTVSTSPFHFKNDLEGAEPRTSLDLVIFVQEGEAAPTPEQLNEQILKESQYALRGGNAFALDTGGKRLKNQGVVITYKGETAIAPTFDEWQIKKAEGAAKGELRAKQAQARENAIEARRAEINKLRAAASKAGNPVTEPVEAKAEEPVEAETEESAETEAED